MTTTKKPYRKRGEGALWQDEETGTWYAQVDVGRNLRGKRVLRRVQAKTLAEVMAKRAKLIENPERRSKVVPGSVRNVVEEWFAGKTGLEVTTRETYRDLIDTRILPAIGDVRAASLRADQVTALYAAARSHSVARQMHAILRPALLAARMPADFFNSARPPKQNKSERKRARQSFKTWTAAEVARFLKANRNDRLIGLYELALLSGMRQGELLGLKWSALRLDARHGEVRIAGQLQEVANKPKLLDATKGGHDRVIPLPPRAVTALKKHRTRMRAEVKGGRAVNADDLVFVDTEGNPLRKSNLIRRAFKPAIKLAAVPEIRFHDMRHTHATLWLEAGQPIKELQQRLGHSSIVVTMDIYAHGSDERHAAGALALEKFVDAATRSAKKKRARAPQQRRRAA